MDLDEQLTSSPLLQEMERRAVLDPECFDAVMAHGHLTAQVLSPSPDTPEKIVEHLLSSPAPSDAEKKQLIEATQQLLTAIDNQFNDEQVPLALPFTLEEDEELLESPLTDWCAAFMEVHMDQQDAWLGDQEEEMTQLLLPIALLSALFVDEEPFQELYEDEELLYDMVEHLPQLLTDLYLQFKGQAD